MHIQNNNLKRLFLPVFLFSIGLTFIEATAESSPNEDKPHTFLINPHFLSTTKQRIKKDRHLQKVLSQLKIDADKALQRGPYSVVFKEQVPPSGNKHDYMSVGPYWWPDSSKKDGLPYIRKDGVGNPERAGISDNKHLNSLYDDVHLLGLAWFYTHDKKYADHAARLLDTWFLDNETKMNPHLNYGQAIPGITEGRGIGLIDTHNVTRLIDGIQLLKDSPSLSREAYQGIQNWYSVFLEWMISSPIGLDEAKQPNNHGTWYDVQVVSIALFTNQQDLAKRVLEEDTKKRIDRQLEDDGAQPLELRRTRSWTYANMNLKGFFELALLAENVQVDLWNYDTVNGKSLKEAFLWLLPYAEGKKTWDYTQISPISSYLGYLNMAKVAQEKYPDIDLKPLWVHHNININNLLPLTDWTY